MERIYEFLLKLEVSFNLTNEAAKTKQSQIEALRKQAAVLTDEINRLVEQSNAEYKVLQTCRQHFGIIEEEFVRWRNYRAAEEPHRNIRIIGGTDENS